MVPRYFYIYLKQIGKICNIRELILYLSRCSHICIYRPEEPHRTLGHPRRGARPHLKSSIHEGPRFMVSELFQLKNNQNLGKHNDPQSVNRTVAIVLGVLFGVLLIIMVPSLCIYRCTHIRRSYRHYDWLFHRRQGHKMLFFGKRAISSHGEGGQGGPGMPGQRVEPGQRGGDGHTIVGDQLLNNDTIRGHSGASVLQGLRLSHSQTHQNEGNDIQQGGGTGTGGAAYGGRGGRRGTGGRGGKGGRGGQGGRATAHTELYASVYVWMMCCVNKSPRRDSGCLTSCFPCCFLGSSGKKRPGPRGPRGWAGHDGSPGGLGFPGASESLEESGPSHHSSRPERQSNIHIIYLNEGGAGGGGEASGGEGGHGGQGGEDGRGGRGCAKAFASTPIYPQLMYCVFVRPCADRGGSHQEHK